AFVAQIHEGHRPPATIDDLLPRHTIAFDEPYAQGVRFAQQRLQRALERRTVERTADLGVLGNIESRAVRLEALGEPDPKLSRRQRQYTGLSSGRAARAPQSIASIDLTLGQGYRHRVDANSTVQRYGSRPLRPSDLRPIQMVTVQAPTCQANQNAT